MIDQANEITGADREKATQMFIDAQKILIDQAVAIFYYDVADVHIARTDVKGYVDNPAYPHVAFVYQMSR
jgi:peptide/nickel transport system substrate-binding protein